MCIWKEGLGEKRIHFYVIAFFFSWWVDLTVNEVSVSRKPLLIFPKIKSHVTRFTLRTLNNLFPACTFGYCLAMLCYAKSLQSCPTLCDPIDGSYQAPPSLGFSRQEHWSGLPFPSPMHESEKWKRSRSVMSDPQWPHGQQPSRLLCPWDFPGKSTGVGCHYQH